MVINRLVVRTRGFKDAVVRTRKKKKGAACWELEKGSKGTLALRWQKAVQLHPAGRAKAEPVGHELEYLAEGISNQRC